MFITRARKYILATLSHRGGANRERFLPRLETLKFEWDAWLPRLEMDTSDSCCTCVARMPCQRETCLGLRSRFRYQDPDDNIEQRSLVVIP